MIENALPYVVSVVRDPVMYDMCVGRNPFFDSFERIAFDNNKDNLSIPYRYNSFLDPLPEAYQGWIVFCHEDWKCEEDLSLILPGLDRDKIYGPIGVFIQHRLCRDYIIAVGKIKMCDKNGRRLVTAGRHCPKSGRVDCLDCQCVIVHSSLIRKYKLRFDENLSFDMYVEDFCASAHENFGIITEVVPIRCIHFSYGVLGESFRKALEYVQQKFKNARKGYITPVGYKCTFGYRQKGPLHHTHFPRLALRLNGKHNKRNL